jgi:hypothetical protein
MIDDCMKLGFGMMRLPRMEGTNDIDLEHTKRMVVLSGMSNMEQMEGVVLASMLIGGLGELALTGGIEATVQDVTIGWPGMLLQVIGAYLVCKYL